MAMRFGDRAVRESLDTIESAQSANGCRDARLTPSLPASASRSRAASWPSYASSQAGAMFWFRRKKFVGSYFVLRVANRSYFPVP